MKPVIRVRRVYDAPAPDDGARVLVDRIWPRGLRKDAAGLRRLRELAGRGPVTLLTATRDTSISQAAVLTTLLGLDPAEPDTAPGGES